MGGAVTVLVTGGSGTLGAEICRHLVARGQSAVALARDRSRLLTNCPAQTRCITGDVRDLYRLVDVCRRLAITEVVHCAANKHVGECEEQPAEAIQSNVIGTSNVLAAIRECDIPSAVFVSSDKATDGTVYGATKQLGERLVTAAAREEGRALASVRPGNIIGSAGSVVEIWTRAYRRGDPIRLNTYNGQAAWRFVMTRDEAARLVIDGLDCADRGVVIAHRMPIIDIRTLAAVIAPDATIKEGLLPMEWLHQTVIGEEESEYLRPGLSRMVLDRFQSPNGRRQAYSTHHGKPMTLEQTRTWFAGSSHLPADIENKTCS